MTFPFRSAVRAHVAVLGLVATAAMAQRPGAWAELRVPGGVQSAFATQLGKLSVYDESQGIWVFSAVTRRWRSLATSPSAVLRQANDWIVVEDGSTYSAFSSFGGRFVALRAQGASGILNPAAQRNDSVLLIRDQVGVHAFSGFTGKWIHRAFSPGASVAVQRHVAVVVDGGNAFALSGFEGDWVRQPLDGPLAAMGCDGKLGYVETGRSYWAFSADTGRWSRTSSLGGSASRSVSGDVAIWANATNAVAFSGTRGRFVARSTGTIRNTSAERQFAIVDAADGYHAFSGVRASWTKVPATQAAIRSDSMMALFVENNRVLAYSAATGTVAALNVRVTGSAVSAATAAVLDGNSRPHVYSALTATWHAAPAGAPNRLPTVARHAALFATANGHTAFSARSGRFTPLTTGVGTLGGGLASSIVTVAETNRLHIFDARRERWTTLSPLTSATQSLWRTTWIATDTKAAYGFGSQSGEVEHARLPLPAQPLLQVKTSSECGTILLKNSLFAFSAVPDLTATAQFPEFRRVLTRGAPVRLKLAATSGSASVVALSALRVPSLALPGLGDLWLDPAALVLGPPGVVGSEGIRDVRFTIPDAPELVGLELFFQALVAPTSGSAYLTRLASVRVF